MLRIPVHPRRPQSDAIERAAAVIRAGGVVAIPTDTLYGLAADPFRADAVARVFAAKSRPDQRALPLIAGSADQIAQRLGALPPAGHRLATRFWPGPLTLLVPATPALAAGVSGGSGRVGVRVPAHDAARALCEACGTPLTATSANLSGEAASADPTAVAAALAGRIDAILDAGPTPGGSPSTIVDVTVPEPTLVRAGAIPWEDVLACLAG